jgi:hypothetical protein
MINVRYLSEDEIEKEAELLLDEYAETIGRPIKFPVPIDDITIYHLALRLGFADLHETLRIPMLRDQPDVLGAIWVEGTGPDRSQPRPEAASVHGGPLPLQRGPRSRTLAASSVLCC